MLQVAGCYVHAPIDRSNAQQGEEVRLLLAEPGTRRLSAAAGRPIERLEGRVVASSADSPAVSVWVGRDYRGTPFQTAHRTFTVAYPELIVVQRRQLSTWRTAVLGFGVARMAVLVATLSGDGPVEGEVPDRGDPPERTLVGRPR